MKSKNILRVEYGSIYTQYNTMIDNMTIIFNKDMGVHKYGEARDVEKDYEEIVLKSRKAGLDEWADNFILIKFDRYEGSLTIEEVCTFVNYMIMVSANSDKNLEMLNMETKELKIEIKKLQEIGF